MSSITNTTVHEMGLRTLVKLEVAEFRTEGALIGKALEVRKSQFIFSVQSVRLKSRNDRSQSKKTQLRTVLSSEMELGIVEQI